ncbi:hypothetical protein ACJJTC_019561 [Scirpophaga incertulas]
MGVSDCWVLRKMVVRHSMFKLLLFQILVAWCSAKHIMLDNNLPNLQFLTEDLEDDVQNNIRNLIHTGIYSHRHLDTSQVQVTTPVKVTRDGELMSRVVEHTHAHGHARARRDLTPREHEQPHSLHYNLTVDGRELRIDLRPSVSFITPALIVERHRVGERTRDRPHIDSTACHFTGSIRGQPASNIALSACDGLAGLLRTEHGEYWIEPSNQKPSDPSQGRPHVIFKRSAIDKVKAYHRAKREIERDEENLNRKPQTSYGRDNINRRTQRRGDQRIINRTQGNQSNNSHGRRDRERKLAIDRRRREYLEMRRRKLEAMRTNPVEYRRQQDRLRMQQRRLVANSRRTSISVESKSVERNRNTNINKNRKNISDELRLRRMKSRRRRRRESNNCATKQPPYQWKTRNYDKHDIELQKNQRYNKYSARSNQRQGRQNSQDGRRATRSVSRPRHVEVLLVADKSMTKFHDEPDNLTTYLLTIMNMVSSLYMDPSIGNYIKVVVVKIIFVEEMDAAPDLEVTTNADTTLQSFCRWQQQLNPDDDSNPHHHDVAILITRQDICSQHGNPCSTLGVAHVAGMCKPDRSCSVNEDNGIMLAHTITHELGHNFGLYHDTEKIGCHRREGSTLHIMTPIFEADTVQVAWSRCSKRDVTNFLDAGMGECLSDRPSQEEYTYPEVPAGVMFNAENQCRLQFGADAVVCAKPSELCEHLWCLVNNTCKTMLRPAAPGTTCGPDMWCQNQTCVDRTPSPTPRDGGWGPWTAWSECSRTCGAGVSTQSRECNNPEPENNGNYCIGDRSRYKICNTDPCPINEPTFREVQCSKYNNKTYNNMTVAEWIPYFDQDRPCELKCIPRDDIDLEIFSPAFVADGTPCRQTVGSRDMCIAGVCYKVGCDWEVNSDVEEDACGVCGGNGSACKTVQGIYSKGTTKQSGFSEVVIIPAGSRNVKIQEKVSPGNYISIGSAKSKKFFLSGARNATLTEYFVAGAQAIYERDRDWEKVRITGPIEEDIKVYQRIFRGRHRNPGVTYQYTVDRARRRFSYRLSEWSPCSATCGTGYTRRHYECVNEHNHVVEQSQCYHIEPPRHEALMQRCRLPACPHWWVGAWESCSKPCHMPGEEATKHRNIYCVDKTRNDVVEDSRCDEATKPISVIKCADVPPC